jgi:hypothetical protein
MRLSFGHSQPKTTEGPALAPVEERSFQTPAPPPVDEAYLQLKTDMHRRLIEAMNLTGLDRRPPE